MVSILVSQINNQGSQFYFHGVSPRGVVANVLDCNIVVSEFEF